MIAEIFRVLMVLIKIAVILVVLSAAAMFAMISSSPREPNLISPQPPAATEDMACRDVVRIFDATEPDKIRYRAILNAMDRIYVALDAERAVAGRSRIFARMNETGQIDAKIHAVSQCRKSPGGTLRQSAVAAYEGIEALGRAIGIND